MVTIKSDPGTPDSHISHLLLSAFGRAIVHRLRTPLSVISNELAYMKASSDFSDYEKIEKKCADIATELASISAFCSLGGAFEKSTAKDFLEEFFGALTPEPAASRLVFIHSESLGFALKTLTGELLPRLNASNKNIAFSCTEDATSITISADFDFKQAAYFSSEEPGCSSTFSSFFSSSLGIDLTVAPVVDSILIMHGILLSLGARDEKLEFSLRIPTCEDIQD